MAKDLINEEISIKSSLIHSYGCNNVQFDLIVNEHKDEISILAFINEIGRLDIYIPKIDFSLPYYEKHFLNTCTKKEIKKLVSKIKKRLRKESWLMKYLKNHRNS